MKQILLLALSFFAIESYSQKLVEGSLLPLRDAEKVQFVLDYSNAYILGMTEEEFGEYEKDWKVDKPQISSMFMTAFRDAIGERLRIGRYTDADYVIRVNVLDISTNGDFECEVIVEDSSSKTIAKIVINEKGGRFGSKLNLIKDGAQHTGKALGMYMKRKIR